VGIAVGAIAAVVVTVWWYWNVSNENMWTPNWLVRELILALFISTFLGLPFWVISEEREESRLERENVREEDRLERAQRSELIAALIVKDDLTGIVLAGQDLQEVVFTGRDLTDANLAEANLTGANLTDADLRTAVLFDVILAEAELAGADLTGANLAGANLRSADLFDVSLTRADLTGADLTGANLAAADLSKAALEVATLQGTDLTGANLDGANLRGANLTDVVLSGTKSDEQTVWPDGFDAPTPTPIAAPVERQTITGTVTRVDRDGTRLVVRLGATELTPPEGRYGVTAEYLDSEVRMFVPTGRWSEAGPLTNADSTMHNDSLQNLINVGLLELGVYVPPGILATELRLTITTENAEPFTLVLAIPPPVPTDLRESNQGFDAAGRPFIALTWSKQFGIPLVQIERNGVIIRDDDNLSYRDLPSPELFSGQVVTYRIRAVRDEVTSAWSPPITVTVN